MVSYYYRGNHFLKGVTLVLIGEKLRMISIVHLCWVGFFVSFQLIAIFRNFFTNFKFKFQDQLVIAKENMDQRLSSNYPNVPPSSSSSSLESFANCPSIELSNRVKMPLIGLGNFHILLISKNIYSTLII